MVRWWQSKKQNLSRVTTASLWPARDVDICILSRSLRLFRAENAETSLIHVLTVVRGTLHPSLCAGETKQKGKVTEKDPKEQHIQIFSFSADKSPRSAESFHSPGLLHHYLIPGLKGFGLG